MARPSKKGLRYFPLDTDFLSDRKIQRLALRYQHTGICVYLTLLCEIYRTHGYYTPYSQELLFDIGFTLGIEEAVVKEVVAFCVDVRLFDKPLLEQQHVLTSAAIQERYLMVRKKSNLLEVDPALSLSGKHPVNPGFAGVNLPQPPDMAAKPPVFYPETPQKEKESKNKKETKPESANENEKRTTHATDEERMAELLRMYRDATTNSQDV